MILYLLVACQGATKVKTKGDVLITEKQRRILTKKLKGVYDSTLVCRVDQSYTEDCTNPRFLIPAHHTSFATNDLKYDFTDLYEERTLHRALKKQHQIELKGLEFEKKEDKLAWYTMTLDIDGRTLEFPLRKHSYEESWSSASMEWEAGFFWEVYKDEPQACAVIAKMFSGNLITGAKKYYGEYAMEWVYNMVTYHQTDFARYWFFQVASNHSVSWDLDKSYYTPEFMKQLRAMPESREKEATIKAIERYLAREDK